MKRFRDVEVRVRFLNIEGFITTDDQQQLRLRNVEGEDGIMVGRLPQYTSGLL